MSCSDDAALSPTVTSNTASVNPVRIKAPTQLIVKTALESFYSTHSPDKHWTEIYSLVDRHIGRERELLLKIADKYAAHDELAAVLRELDDYN